MTWTSDLTWHRHVNDVGMTWQLSLHLKIRSELHNCF